VTKMKTRTISLMVLCAILLTACSGFYVPGVTKKPVAEPTAQPAALPEVPAGESVNLGSQVNDEGQTGCPQARDLGPWAPNADGSGETFEVTSTLGDSAGIVLGLWWPHGQTGWQNKEVTTFVDPGLSIEVQNGAGRGFDYPLGCAQTEIDRQMQAHMSQRAQDTQYHDFVDVDELIRLGLVRVRFDRRMAEVPVARPTAQVTAQPSAGVCNATRQGDSDDLATITAPADATFSVEAWGGSLGDSFVVIPKGETVTRTWQGGAIWSYPCGTDAVVLDVSRRNKPVYVVQDGKLVKQ